MEWKINDFVFNTEHQSLNIKDETLQLEPLQAKVLAYFCEHQNQIVSREQLIQEVWPTSVVSDNTVNRIIAKLRKVLGDSSQAPRYIVTHPRQGYMFVADVQIHICSHKTYKWYLPAASLIILTTIFLLHQIYNSAVHRNIVSVQPLTRGVAPEYHPAISPDEKYLAYSTLKKQRLSLHLKHLETGMITDLTNDDIWSGYPTWSADGSMLAYMRNTEESCRIEVTNLLDGQLIEQEALHHCPKGNFAKLVFSHDDKTLFYAERQSSDSPYFLYRLDLKTGKSTRLKQPEPLHAGHFHFDLHPSENALLVATPDEQLWLNLYRLDLESNEYSLLFKLDEYLCCAIWSHDGEAVVMMSENPGYELVEYTLEGNSSRVIYSAGQQVMMPARHSNQKDYLFVEAQNNLDIQVQNRQGDESFIIASSTVDTLPAVSPDGKKLTYLSHQSGRAEIWLHEFETAKNSKLSHFTDHSHYLALTWSPDQRYIAVLSLNGIKLMDVETGQLQWLKLPQTRMKYLSWQDDRTLTFSAKTLKGWQVRNYDIENHQNTLLKSPYKAVVHNRKNRSKVWLSHEGELLFDDSHETMTLSDAIASKRFGEHIVVSGNVIYYSVFEEGAWKLKKWDQLTQSGESITSSDGPISFDVWGENVYFSKIKSIHADVFTTKIH